MRNLYKLPTDVKLPQKVINFNLFPLEKKEKMIEKSLKMISEGKMCVVIDATASMQLLESDEPACTKKNLGFGLPVNFSILEFFFKRLKDLGSLAVEKFGKNHGFNREPILVVVAVSEGDIDEVDEELVKNGYYGYQGVLCFCTVRKLFFLKYFHY